MKLFGYRNRSIQARKAPQEESGKYTIFELAIVDEEFDSVGSIGLALRSDEVVNPAKEAERKAKTEAKLAEENN